MGRLAVAKHSLWKAMRMMDSFPLQSTVYSAKSNSNPPQGNTQYVAHSYRYTTKKYMIYWAMAPKSMEAPKEQD